MNMRYGSGNYQNNNTVPSGQSGKGKPVSPATLKKNSPSTVLELESEGSDTSSEIADNFSKTNSIESAEGTEKNLFSNQDIHQVETSSRASDILKASYIKSNRAAVALGLVGGVVGGCFGMSVGSSVGTHGGFAAGVLQEYLSSPPVAETGDAAREQSDHDVAGENHFSSHVIQVVDHAGHHAAVGSIGVGVAALLISLATGNPIPAALHAAGIYSGAAWMFGLTTGTASWLRQHVQRSADAAQREQATSPGDIELLPLGSNE